MQNDENENTAIFTDLEAGQLSAMQDSWSQLNLEQKNKSLAGLIEPTPKNYF